MSAIPKTSSISMPFKNLIVMDETNIRTDLPRVKELAEDLKLKGQITPILVSPTDDPEKFMVRAGFRRCAAYVLNGWQNRDIMVVVREYKKGDHIGPIVDNWTENVQREAVSYLDLAECMHQLATGTYPVPEGETAEAVDREEISSRFGVSTAHVGKLLKIFRNIDADVARSARRADAPVRLLIQLSAIEGDGEDEAQKDEDRALKQQKVLDAWTKQREDLLAEGRQRSVRSDKGRGKSARGGSGHDDKPPPPVSPTKKIGPVGRDGGASAFRRPAEDYLKVLLAKQEEAAKEEKLRIEGMVAAFKFVTGKIAKLPGLSAADFKILDVEV